MADETIPIEGVDFIIDEDETCECIPVEIAGILISLPDVPKHKKKN